MKARQLVLHSFSKRASRYTDIAQVFAGSLYMAVLSQIEIPLLPIPATLQTFALFTLALFLGSKKSFYSLILYLAEGTMGLPVFHGGVSNPLWMAGPTAGFCLSFPFAAYAIGRISESGVLSPFFRFTLALLCGEAIIYGMGLSWLSISFGWNQAIQMGLLPFLFIDLLKISSAISFKMGCSFRKSCEKV